MVVMFLWCVQEVAGLKEQDLPSDPPTAAGSSSTLSESHMYTSCDSIVIVCSGSVSQTPPSTHSDPPVPSVDLSNIPDDGTLGESVNDGIPFSSISADINTHLAVLMSVLKDTVCQWCELGIQLRLSYFTLREIEKDRREAKECMIEMLAVWLKGQGGECTKHTLRTALLNIDCRIDD